MRGFGRSADCVRGLMGRMEDFCCPVCGGALTQKGKSLYCLRGHCYDLAKSGYVNLFLQPSGGGKKHGDDKGMVTARRDFLSAGYYQPLLDGLIAELGKRMPRGCRLLDAGCGECWYTDGLERALTELGREPRVSGVDISKNALQLGAKRNRRISLAVSSLFRLPVPEGRFDGVVHVFAPFCGAEFHRVLKRGGWLITVLPLENHLMALKRVVYDRPYSNEVTPPMPPGLVLTDRREIRSRIVLKNRQDIQNLFQMTPYFYKTGAKDKAKLQILDSLETEIEFGIFIYRKA